MLFQNNRDNGLAINLTYVSSIEPKIDLIEEGYLFLGFIPLTRWKLVDSNTECIVIMTNGTRYNYKASVNDLIKYIKTSPKEN